MSLTPAWHIDAWAVHDGLAFASHRPAGQRLAARRCVYLAVPALEPEPVPGPSAAWWAAHAGFQQGFFDDEGQEIDLPDLAAVRELVRRGYLAGGTGPGPLGPRGEPPPLDSGPGPASTYLEEGLARLADSVWGYPGSGALFKREARAGFLHQMSEGRWPELLFEHLRLFAEATLVACAWQVPSPRAADLNVNWLACLSQSALWPDAKVLDEVLQHPNLRPLAPLWAEAQASWLHRRGWPGAADDGPALLGLLQRVPCPLRADWVPGIRCLADKLYLATSQPDYFVRNRNLPALLPSLLVALLATEPLHPRWQAPWAIDRRARLATAFDWLFEQLPQQMLPAAAEIALSRFAWQGLGAY